MNLRNIKFLWGLIGLLAFLNVSAQDSTQVLWEKANAYYTTEEYQQAISAYEQILQEGQESAKLYFNLGNAYYKTGDINNAILNYERAKLLAPQDEDIRFNLELANQLVTTEIEELPKPFFVQWRTKAVNLFPADTWSVISTGAFIIFLGLLGLFLFSRRIAFRKLAFWLGILSFIISGLTYSFAAHQTKKIAERNEGIVFCPRVTVKSSPSETGTDLFLLYEGVKVEVSDSLNTWKEIRLSDGNVGWLPDSCIVKI
ncbi:MAG: tetratricopeptide repeat protein [Tangfeifania sp.]